MAFLTEIRRRKLFQVAAVYAVTAWLLIQIVATIKDPLNLPGWFDTAIIVLLAIAFPVTLILSWAFNLTSAGLVRDTGGVAPKGGRTLEYDLFALLVASVGWIFHRVEFNHPQTRAVEADLNIAAADPYWDGSNLLLQANVYADPVLEQPEFVELRKRLGLTLE